MYFSEKTSYSEESLSAFYFPTNFSLVPIPQKYAQMIGYSDCIVDTTTAKFKDDLKPGWVDLPENWASLSDKKKAKLLDKSKPVFVYCLSGGRSSSAANKMRSDGFKEVYELSGGIMKWRGANLPETTDNAVVSNGMSKQQFDALLSSDKLVLIDFYADWCAPCKKMKPYLEEISKDMADKVVVIRINADDNQALCKELKIDALPVLQLYKNKTLSWTNTGFIEKAEVVKQLQ